MIALLYVTHPDADTAKEVAESLLARRLIACYNLFPIRSWCWWGGSMTDSDETVTLLKTRPDLADAVEAAVLAAHPYEVPCVVRMTASANAGYEEWIARETVTE